jgi:hypothetical protein
MNVFQRRAEFGIGCWTARLREQVLVCLAPAEEVA